MNRLRMLLMMTTLIAGSSALASAEAPDHDRDRNRDHNSYTYQNGGGYNNGGYYNSGRYNNNVRNDRDDRWRGDRDDQRRERHGSAHLARGLEDALPDRSGPMMAQVPEDVLDDDDGGIDDDAEVHRAERDQVGRRAGADHSAKRRQQRQGNG